ncbi:MAG: 50S ribosomal protein L9 [Phycisphaerales bacterium]|nr:50S ribosomal protein L9 [Phycisphaerales bacterium]
MAKNIELLLTENVENLGIVGDVVKVRNGYARNFLLPRNLATTPSDELVQKLATKRAAAEQQVAELRTAREAMIHKMDGLEIETVHACNDQGILYAAVTQSEISTALNARAFEVRPRDVRLGQTIKRIGTYEVHIKFEAELESIIKLVVKPDRELDLDDDRNRDYAAAASAPAATDPDASAVGQSGTEDEGRQKSELRRGEKMGSPASTGGASSAGGGKKKK